MSVIIGLNSGKTRFGKPLKDGATCLVKNGEIISSIPEERLTGNKHEGGFEKGLDFVLKQHNLNTSDVDLIVHSSCCEEEFAPEIKHFDSNRIVSLNHHHSHAYNAFCLSPFEESIVAVIDAGGNVLEKMRNNKWWEHRREQHSFFIASDNGIELIERDCDGPLETGIGELMRAFTYFLGWPSGTLAGNTMAAGKVKPNREFEHIKLFELKDGKIISPCVNSPYKPSEVVTEILKEKLGLELYPNPYGTPLTDCHFRVANWIQWNIEEIICKKIDYLVNKTGITNVCLSGGVAYNCPTIAAIRNKTSARSVFVSWTSGDHGQAIGNALYGVNQVQPIKLKTFTPYTGGKYDILEKQIVSFIEGQSDISFSLCEDISSSVVDDLLKSKIIAMYNGRSESGPRALGNRSILARASDPSSKDKLNRIKSRMDFMPIAPVVHKKNTKDLFAQDIEIPFMTETLFAKDQDIVKDYPSAFHCDHSARVQTISDDSNTILKEILRKIEEENGEKLVLNTSFNLKGRPIVEYPQDAINTFLAAKEIDTLYINNFRIARK